MLKNKSGITLTILVITVIIMVLILGTLTYSSVDSVNTKKINNFYSDLRQIRDAVEIYYLKTGNLPVDTSKAYIAANKNETREALVAKEIDFVLKDDMDSVGGHNSFINPNDYVEEENSAMYKFVKLDLLKGITLYNENDEYVVNTESHTIYNYTGINIDNEIYHGLPLQYKYVK